MSLKTKRLESWNAFSKWTKPTRPIITKTQLAKCGLFITACASLYSRHQSQIMIRDAKISRLESILKHQLWNLDGMYYTDDPWGNRWMFSGESCNLVWKGGSKLSPSLAGE